MNARVEAHDITTELLLEVFDIPVSFHRCLVPVTGGITSALMLSLLTSSFPISTNSRSCTSGGR